MDLAQVSSFFVLNFPGSEPIAGSIRLGGVIQIIAGGSVTPAHGQRAL